MKKAAILFILSLLINLPGMNLKAQQNKSNVSVFVESQEELIEEVAGEYVLHFYMLYDDRYTSAKEIKFEAESLDDVTKFGIRNSPHEKTGRYLCYIKTESSHPKDVFLNFLKKFKCMQLSFAEKEISVDAFKNEMNNVK